MAILEECLTHDITSVLLIEDDATFIKDFSAKAEQFIANLPQDWSFIYFGGQHIEQDVRLPRRVNDFVYIPYNVNRTHCFALRGRPMMELVYRHLNAIPSWSADHHVDHHLGELHKTLHSGLYVPREWLVGQEPGYSDINGKQWSQLTFRGAEELTSGVVDLQMVAVLGQFRAGTSCVAGILHAVGINMGAKFPKPDAANMSGYFEAEGLANICRMACREPWMTKAMLREDRRNLLRRWAANRCAQLRGDCAITGGKHPSLCFMGPDLLDAWNDPKFVIVDRPINESIDSVLRTRWGWPEAAVRYALPRLASYDQST